MSTVGCIALLTRNVISQEFSRCYDDLNICLWTDGSLLNQSAAQAACHQRGNSFLPRVTNNVTQSKLADFRSVAQWNGQLLVPRLGILIDVRAVGPDSFHWIDGNSLTGFVNDLTFTSEVAGLT